MGTFGEKIANARKAAGMTQRELAAAIAREDGEHGISPAYLNDIEHGRRIPNGEPIITEFARHLHLDAKYLLLLASRQLPEQIASKARKVDEETYRQALSIFEQALETKEFSPSKKRRK
jgi:transcriptional regulator with XRE-family HTH domain